MSFMTPLGLLGLIGVLLLILIYILKPKYQEKSISSTFVWKLSLKYKRNKMPFQWLKSSLLVILQFLILLIITLGLTTPLFSLDTQGGEKIIILDSSANMFAQSGGKTRFEIAVQEIGALADATTPDDRFTVILAGKEASFVARRLDSAIFIKQLLSELSPSFEDADIDSAIKLSEGVLAENPNAEVILFTGNQYNEIGLITVRDMSRSEWNVAILDFSSSIKRGYHVFNAQIASYNKEASVDVKLYINDVLTDIKTIQMDSNQEVLVSFEDLDILNYAKAEIILDYEDDFIHDNRFAIFSWENELFNVQLVSESPRFLQAALLTIGGYKVTIPVAPDDQTPVPIQYQGYDLYIFDNYLPEYMPVDGSVWLINPPAMPSGINLSLGVNLTGNYTLSAPSIPTSLNQLLLNSIDSSEITLSSYKLITDYEDFEVVLYNDVDPVILTKDLDGPQLFILAFSLHNSNLPIIPEYILLMHNMGRYSVQNMIGSYLHHAGDEIQIRRKASALQMTLSNKSDTLTFNQFPVNVKLDQVGTHTITQSLASGETASVDFFVRVARNQSDFTYNYGALSNPVITNTSGDSDASQDTLDIIYYLIIILIVFLLIEWGLHYNENN
jgi:Ca-activated chloride channel homolog